LQTDLKGSVGAAPAGVGQVISYLCVPLRSQGGDPREGEGGMRVVAGQWDPRASVNATVAGGGTGSQEGGEREGWDRGAVGSRGRAKQQPRVYPQGSEARSPVWVLGVGGGGRLTQRHRRRHRRRSRERRELLRRRMPRWQKASATRTQGGLAREEPKEARGDVGEGEGKGGQRGAPVRGHRRANYPRACRPVTGGDSRPDVRMNDGMVTS